MLDSIQDVMLFITKIVLLIYVICVMFFNPVHFMWIDTIPIKIALASIVIGVLWIDTTLAILLAICFMLTILKVQSYEIGQQKEERPKQLTPTREEVNTKDVHEYIESKSKRVENTDPELAKKALEKYEIEKYMAKASEDGILLENKDKYLNPLGLQMNIQGIEESIVGYNYH